MKEAIEEVVPHVQHLLDSFLSSLIFLKYQIDVMTKGNVCLSDILYYDPTLFHFLEFMDIERCRVYVDFLLMVRNLKSIEAGPSDAEVLCLKFFDPESVHYIPFSEGLRNKTKELVKQGDMTAFDLPQDILHQYLEKTYFRQFLESQIYIDFLTERINHLQKSQLLLDGDVNRFLLPQQREKKCHSSKSTPESTASPATDQPSCPDFIQVDKRKSHPLHRSRDTFDHDDHLWSRDFAGRLQITHVDRYGKVMSDFQPEPDSPAGNSSSSSSRKTGISHSFLKFVGKKNSVDDAKQDKAWKEAEQIVNDVLSVTLEYS